MDDNPSVSPSLEFGASQSSCQAENQSDLNIKFDIIKNKNPNGIPVPSSIPDINNSLVFSEASKLIQIGFEKDFALSEKNNAIQEANETIDNLRRNIVHLQMEYETLDQNYNKELAFREEVMKRIETTRNMIESAAEYSTILTASIKQLENDKLKLIEFYDLIYQRQEEAEKKYKNVDDVICQQEFTMKKELTLAAESEKRSIEKSNLLSHDLLQTQIMLKRETEKNQELEMEIVKSKNEVNEIRSAFQSEQNYRVKYQTIYLHMRKKIIKNRSEDSKLWNVQKTFYKKSIKVLNSKLKVLQEKLDEYNTIGIKHLDIIKDMEIKIVNLEKDLELARDSNQKTIKDLNESLKSSLTEKDSLAFEVDKLKTEVSLENQKNKKLEEESERLADIYEEIKSKLQVTETDLSNTLEENLRMKRNMEELNAQLNIKTLAINDLENKLQSQYYEKGTEKISALEEELERYKENEEILKKEIILLNNIMNRDSSDILDKISEQQLSMIFQEVRKTLEGEELEKSKLRITIQELQKTNNKLCGDLNETFEKEKSKIDEHEKTVKKLQNDIDRRQKLLESQQEKLNEADSEILELKNTIQRLKENENAITSLKKSLELAKADIESYKEALKAMETEVKSKRSTAEEPKKNLELETSQWRQIIQGNENVQKAFETPKRQNSDKIVELGAKSEEVAGFLSPRASTPKPTRRLLSTPARHLRSPFPSPKFKSISPVRKSSDPYEYDSDSGSERFGAGQRTEVFPLKQKNEKVIAKKRK